MASQMIKNTSFLIDTIISPIHLFPQNSIRRFQKTTYTVF